MPSSDGSTTCSWSFEELHGGRADERAPDVADAADHRHEQVLDAHVEVEGRRVHGALEVREQPAGDARQQRREHEHGDLDAEGVDAHRLGHLRAALDRAHRSAGARIEQVGHGERRRQHAGPEQVEEAAAGVELDAEEAERRHAEQAVVLAERLDVAEQVVERQAPGDRRERQVVARHAQRDPAERERGERR